MPMNADPYANILAGLPFGDPFLFVDRITYLDENRIEGFFKFHAELDFYRGHFKDVPVTPGVLLTECCAQIGLACLGLYLTRNTISAEPGKATVALSQSSMEFRHPVFPGEEVRVTGEKKYFRFKKLKVAVRLYTEAGVLACKGELAGMIKPQS